MIHVACRSHNTEHCLLAEYGWKNGHTNINKPFIQLNAEMAILWDTLFCDIQIRKNLNARDQWGMDILLNRHILHNNTINTHPDFRLPLERLDMDITRFRLDRTLYKTVQQMDNRCLIVTVVKVFDFKLFCCYGGKADICLSGGLFRADLSEIIGNSLP